VGEKANSVARSQFAQRQNPLAYYGSNRLGPPRTTRTSSSSLNSRQQLLSSGRRWSLVRGSHASLGVDMESVQKALWFLESRFRGEVSLDELSQVAGLSRYHFAHVFARATGQSAMRYMRGRRLSEAARVLANSGPDILSVALDFGYGSHEAFTRAFRDQFGLTPESVRAQRHLDNVNLVEAIKMDDDLITTLTPPRRATRVVADRGPRRKVFLRHPPKHSGFMAALAAPSRQRPWASFCGRRRQRGADVWRLL
jgi:AraC-like DNA-binding protein